MEYASTSDLLIAEMTRRRDVLGAETSRFEGQEAEIVGTVCGTTAYGLRLPIPVKGSMSQCETAGRSGLQPLPGIITVP